MHLPSALCVLFFSFFSLNVKAFSRAAISRFIRKAAHLLPLNASQQRAPPLSNAGRPFPRSHFRGNRPISADGHHRGHHGNSPVTVAGARQVPEENLCSESRSNAAAILLKNRNKIELRKEKKNPKKNTHTHECWI